MCVHFRQPGWRGRIWAGWQGARTAWARAELRMSWAQLHLNRAQILPWRDRVRHHTVWTLHRPRWKLYWLSLARMDEWWSLLVDTCTWWTIKFSNSSAVEIPIHDTPTTKYCFRKPNMVHVATLMFWLNIKRIGSKVALLLKLAIFYFLKINFLIL